MGYAFNGYSCIENYNLITNFDKCEEPIYREAIKLYGWGGLTITEDAYWLNGTKDNGMSALRWATNERRDLSQFWKIFEGLKYD